MQINTNGVSQLLLQIGTPSTTSNSELRMTGLKLWCISTHTSDCLLIDGISLLIDRTETVLRYMHTKVISGEK